MVVTAPEDKLTQTYVGNMEKKVKLHVTDAFYRDGATFNKFRAMEEALDVYGRHGLLCIMDADILWPQEVLGLEYHLGFLYVPKRYMLDDVTKWTPTLDWTKLPLNVDVEFAGYSQIFHAEDPRLGKPPWHQIDWKHAGGADSFFQYKWPEAKKVRPPFRVLHLGEARKNWCGRSTPYTDGSLNPMSKLRQEQLREMTSHRHGPNPYLHEKIDLS
jgi:hypothetical protein